ncbi:hypothetical protein BBJ29_009212 [Phytophthora kernoviae]|uniref:Protein kinase domain-containing protein n=1 Tax=Phytophthora kernoviae TaxID=325452 RepID=A0A3F2RL50_9STRA|nr:hypothetical protein BBJ29_009212 [Phytophthora kernoviae]RLN58558.1 hypothetical protein BBP00_00006937 [Phytophthora kernoviae]
MGVLGFLTCGACSSRRKRGHESFPDTITIPTPTQQQHEAAQHQQYQPHHHPYEIHGSAAAPVHGQARRNTQQGDDRSSSNEGRRAQGERRTSNGQQRARGNSRPQQYQPQQHQQHQYPDPAQHQPRNRPPAHSRHDRPVVRNIEPVAPEKVRQSGGSLNSSGNNRDSDITDKSREVAARVLQQFQSDPTLGRRRIPYSSLYFTRVLSKGAFGEVWLAQLENKQVAVKRILNEKKNDEKEIECFGAEIKLMASFSHPKIVEFMGVSWSSMQDVCAVTEYMSKGDLYGFLKRRQGQLNWRDHKIFLAEDVADALGYLHGLSPKVIHRDLKSKNILLDDAFRAKLSDFGISRERSVEDTMTAGVGTIYWTAPEVLMGKKYTEKADIFSFGIVMSELDTHAVPYSDKRDNSGKKLQGMKIVQMVIRRQLRPTFSSECPPLVKELADRCLDADPDVRPSAMELLRIIQRMQNLFPQTSHEKNGYAPVLRFAGDCGHSVG